MILVPKNIKGKWRVVYINTQELASQTIFDSWEDAQAYCDARELDIEGGIV